MPVSTPGTWPSPISADRIASGARPLSAPRIDGHDIYWLQGQPEEGGRQALLRWRAGQTLVLTPNPLNLRSRVHEYGGGAYAVRQGVAVFCNAADQRVFRLDAPATPAQAMTAASACRHADLQFDAPRGRLVAVQEDHRSDLPEPRNTLVALALDAAAAPRELHAGFDFYAAPRLSPDGRRLAWLCWNHPDMPWNGTELWCAEFDADGALARPRRLAGGRGQALCQPGWGPDGALYVVSDHSGWWNLHRVDDSGLTALCPQQAECGEPMWQFGQSLWAFYDPQHIALASIAAGLSQLHLLDVSNGKTERVELPFNVLSDLQGGDGFIVCCAASSTQATRLIRLDLASRQHQVLAHSLQQPPDVRWLSRPRAIEYPSGERTAHAFFYPPTNPDSTGAPGQKPPLLVMSHGGPTAMATPALALSRQFWTSRGFAVLDVNYAGSTGFGRTYRQALDGQWGQVDVQDCVAGARHLAAHGWVDAQRMAIRGGSASGFTTLSALIFHDVFKAGASFYGVADLHALDADTHKFESRYTQHLICAPEDRQRVYAERSPMAHVQRLNCPMLFLQGLDDRVVPPAQSRVIVAALRQRGVPVAYLEFEGEGHGFRMPDTQRRALQAELAFYGRVFGFTPADELPPLDLQ